MTDKELWAEFCSKKNIDINTPYEAWGFGGIEDGDTDALAELVLQGKKFGTASSYDEYIMEDALDEIPKPGDYSVILNSKDEAVCVIRDYDVYVRAFGDVAPFNAYAEGEAAATGRPPRTGGNPQTPELQVHLADIRGAAPRAERRRDGRPENLRIHLRHPQCQFHRCDDRGLDTPPLRHACKNVQPHHQRGSWHQPRRLRHLLQTPRHHRMGVRISFPVRLPHGLTM